MQLILSETQRPEEQVRFTCLTWTANPEWTYVAVALAGFSDVVFILKIAPPARASGTAVFQVTFS